MVTAPKKSVVKKSDRTFTVFLYIGLIIIMFITMYPMWYSLIN